ncbi:hypothetical protein AB0M20_45190 [Actinoplanes sp. NPDC051633]|uniref:hypothetical protein n=1 Tax=Actinoplanes sp. NPDC051633 TaxID=3155670 RepID=UPI00343FF1A6
MRAGHTLFGRAALLNAAVRRLADGGGVALLGPPGIGKSVLLDAIADAASAGGDAGGNLVLRLRPEQGDRGVAY